MTRHSLNLPIHFVGYFGDDTQAVVYVNSVVSVNGGNNLEGIDNSVFAFLQVAG